MLGAKLKHVLRLFSIFMVGAIFNYSTPLLAQKFEMNFPKIQFPPAEGAAVEKAVNDEKNALKKTMSALRAAEEKARAKVAAAEEKKIAEEKILILEKTIKDAKEAEAKAIAGARELVKKTAQDAKLAREKATKEKADAEKEIVNAKVLSAKAAKEKIAAEKALATAKLIVAKAEKEAKAADDHVAKESEALEKAVADARAAEAKAAADATAEREKQIADARAAEAKAAADATSEREKQIADARAAEAKAAADATSEREKQIAEKRAAETKTATEIKAAADAKVAADAKLAVEMAVKEKAVSDKITLEKAAEIKAITDRLVREKAAKDKITLEQASEIKANADRLVREKAAKDKLALERASETKNTAEKVATVVNTALDKAVAEANALAEKAKMAQAEAERALANAQMLAAKAALERDAAEKAVADAKAGIKKPAEVKKNVPVPPPVSVHAKQAAIDKAAEEKAALERAAIDKAVARVKAVAEKSAAAAKAAAVINPVEADTGQKKNQLLLADKKDAVLSIGLKEPSGSPKNEEVIKLIDEIVKERNNALKYEVGRQDIFRFVSVERQGHTLVYKAAAPHLLSSPEWDGLSLSTILCREKRLRPYILKNAAAIRVELDVKEPKGRYVTVSNALTCLQLTPPEDRPINVSMDPDIVDIALEAEVERLRKQGCLRADRNNLPVGCSFGIMPNAGLEWQLLDVKTLERQVYLSFESNRALDQAEIRRVTARACSKDDIYKALQLGIVYNIFVKTKKSDKFTITKASCLY